MAAKSLPASTGKPSCSRRDQWLTCADGRGWWGGSRGEGGGKGTWGRASAHTSRCRKQGAAPDPARCRLARGISPNTLAALLLLPRLPCLVGGQEVTGPGVAPAAERLQPLVLKHLLNHLRNKTGARKNQVSQCAAHWQLLRNCWCLAVDLQAPALTHLLNCLGMSGNHSKRSRRRWKARWSRARDCGLRCRLCAMHTQLMHSKQLTAFLASSGGRWAGIAGRKSRCAAVGLRGAAG